MGFALVWSSAEGLKNPGVKVKLEKEHSRTFKEPNFEHFKKLSAVFVPFALSEVQICKIDL